MASSSWLSFKWEDPIRANDLMQRTVSSRNERTRWMSALGDELVVGSDFSTFFDRSLRGFDRFLVVLLLKVDRCECAMSAVGRRVYGGGWNGPERLFKKVMSLFVSQACS